MTKSIKTMVLTVVLALGAAMPLAAQDLTLAYQFQRVLNVGTADDETDGGLNLPMGFNLDASVPFGTGNLSVLGQFDWSRRSELGSEGGLFDEGSTALSVFGGGLRWTGPSTSGAAPFLQGLVGALRNSERCEIGGVDFCGDASGTHLLLQLGGGVAIPVTPGASVVVGADYRRIFTDIEGTNSFRFVAGVRIGL